MLFTVFLYNGFWFYQFYFWQFAVLKQASIDICIPGDIAPPKYSPYFDIAQGSCCTEVYYNQRTSIELIGCHCIYNSISSYFFWIIIFYIDTCLGTGTYYQAHIRNFLAICSMCITVGTTEDIILGLYHTVYNLNN